MKEENWETRKVDRKGLKISQKLKEFQELGYPRQVRQSACFRLGRETGRRVWFAVGAVQV